MRRAPKAGERVGRWTLRRPLGSGGYGTTWLVDNPSGARAALKLLKGPPGVEIRALSQVCHPAVVGVLDAGMHPVPHLVLELVPGQPLSRLLRAGAPPVDVVLRFAGMLSHALATVHHAGVVHGDIKPENIVVENPRRGRICLIDFGSGRRGGGTLAYAAPELTRGESASVASDVYSLGLVLFELLHGSLPWPELELAGALMRRRSEAPSCEAGPAWLGELVTRMLDPRAGRRPSAAEVADAVAAHGVELPVIDSKLLRRQAARVHVRLGEVQQQLEQWLGDGGTLCITGQEGTGRTHQLERLVVEVQARGWTLLRMASHAEPWTSVEAALRDPALPGEARVLPEGSSDALRAKLAASALLDRVTITLTVVVDDYDHLDPGGKLFVEALSRSGRVRVLLVATDPPPWVERVVSLAPFSEAQVRELIVGMFGDVADLDEVGGVVHAATAGLPGRTVDLLVDAVEQGVLTCPRTRWLCDLGRLGELRVAALRAQAERLSAPARLLGSFLAVRVRTQSMSVLRDSKIVDAAALGPAVEELLGSGLVTREGLELRVASRRAREALVEVSPDPEAVHRRALQRLLGRDPVPWLELGAHLLGAGDETLVRAHATSAVRARLAVDPASAARLAVSLYERWPLPELAGLGVESLVAAGRVEDARLLGRSVFVDRPPTQADLTTLLALAELHLQHLGDHAACWHYIAMAEDLDWEEGEPLDLTIMKANAHFRAGKHDRAIETAQAVADGPPPRTAEDLDRWLTLRLHWAQAVHETGRTPEAIAILDSVPDGLGAGRTTRAMLEASRGRLLWHAGRMDEAALALTQASARDAGLPVLERARLLNNAALANYQVGDLHGALTNWETALALAERLGTQLEQIQIRNNLCIGFREAMRWERARQAGSWAERQAAELAMPVYEAMAAGNLGELELIRGNFEEARARFARCRIVAEAHGLEGELAELARREAELALESGEADALERCVKAAELAAESGSPLEEARALALAAVCHAELGEEAEAEAYLVRAVGSLEERGAARELAEVQLWAGETWIRAEKEDEARRVLGEVLAYANEHGHALLRHRAQKRLDRLDEGRTRPISDHRVLQLLGVSARLISSEDSQRVLEAIADAALLLLDVERAFVLLGPQAQKVAVERGTDGLREERPSRTIIDRCLDLRREVISVDIGQHADLAEAVSVAALGIRSVMCVPFVHEDEILGVMYLDSSSAVDQRMEAAAELMRGLASSAAAALVTTRRISEIRRVAEEAAELVHDLRGPAVSLRAVAESRIPMSRDSGVRDAWETVFDLSQRVIDLTSQWMAPGRRAADPVDLVRLSYKLMRMQRPRAEELAVRIAFSGPRSAPVQVRPVELERALSNLIENALKYTPRGSTVHVEIRAGTEGWLWTVRDAGPGIAPEAQAAIFGRGVQGPSALPGRGLGLAIALRCVEGEGGRLTVGNHPEGGAIFEVWLPPAELGEGDD